MKSAAFALVRPDSLEEAVAALAEHGDEARVIAGGQSLGPLMALRLAAPEVLVDLARIPGLAGIDVTGGDLVIGAMARQRSVERDANVGATAPLVAQAVPNIGHTAIRSQGTVCGSLAHADPAAELPAVAIAANATLVLRGPAGRREVAADDFFTGYYSTAIATGEILEAVRFPRQPARTGTAFVEFSRRHGDFALVGVAVRLTLDEDGTVTDAGIALSGVASTPVRAADAEAMLRGTPADDDALAAAVDAVRTGIDPGADLHATGAYRRHLAGVLVRTALTSALERAALS